MTEEYRNVFKTLPSASALYEFSEGVESRFLELAKTILIRLNSKYLVGYSYDLELDSIIAWFNNQPFHTTSLSMNMVHNAMIKAKFGSNYSISVTNWPLPFRVESRLSFLLGAGNNMGFQLATNISFAMAFVSGFYVMFYIKVSIKSSKNGTINLNNFSYFPIGACFESKIASIRQRHQRFHLLVNIIPFRFLHIYFYSNSDNDNYHLFP